MTNYHYSLQNGLQLNTAYTMPYIMNSTIGLNLIKLDMDSAAIILNFTAISSAGSGIPPGPSATECALFFCVDTYEASVREGVFTQNRISTCISSNETLSNMGATQDFSLTPEMCYFNGTRYDQPHEHTKSCTYNVNWVSRLAMANSLSPLLTGQGSLFASYRPSWSSNTIEALYGLNGNYTDMNSVFSSLSSSLSLNARSQICSATVNGTAWTVVSYVHVRWPRLILPGTLVLLSLIFSVITILHTRNQYIWKSSPLALLFSDLSIDEDTPLRRDPTLKRVDDTSRNMEVWLETTKEGVKLKAVPTR